MDTMLICRQCRAPLPPNSLSNICAACQSDSKGGSRRGRFAPGGGPPPDPAEIAQHFPQLEVLELAAVGGMGVVYKARQPRLDRHVALKILSPELGGDPAFAERFAREAQALARLNHSNIVGIYDFGQAGGHFYFLMEFVDGVNLYSSDSGKIPMPPGKRTGLWWKFVERRQYAHDEAG